MFNFIIYNLSFIRRLHSQFLCFLFNFIQITPLISFLYLASLSALKSAILLSNAAFCLPRTIADDCTFIRLTAAYAITISITVYIISVLFPTAIARCLLRLMDCLRAFCFRISSVFCFDGVCCGEDVLRTVLSSM